MLACCAEDLLPAAAVSALACMLLQCVPATPKGTSALTANASASKPTREQTVPPATSSDSHHRTTQLTWRMVGAALNRSAMRWQQRWAARQLAALTGAVHPHLRLLPHPTLVMGRQSRPRLRE
jgi:hypothetical protein